MSQIQEDRVIEGIALPEPGEWQLDPVHTSVEFVARHLMVSKVRGRFTNVQRHDPRRRGPGRVVGGGRHRRCQRRERRREARRTLAFARLLRRRALPADHVQEHEGRRRSRPDTSSCTVISRSTASRRAVSLEVEYHGWTPDPLGDRRAGFSATPRSIGGLRAHLEHGRRGRWRLGRQEGAPRVRRSRRSSNPETERLDVTTTPPDTEGASTGDGQFGPFPLVLGLDTFGDVTHDEDERPLSHDRLSDRRQGVLPARSGWPSSTR